MKFNKANNFAAYLVSQGLVYAPQKQAAKCFVKQVLDIDAIDWSGDMPDNSFKAAILPSKEKLQEIQGNKIKTIVESPKVFCLGMNVLDLQAFTLLEHVFEKDIYYQARRQNLFIIGFYTLHWVVLFTKHNQGFNPGFTNRRTIAL